MPTQLFIDGKWCDASNGGLIEVLNPATGAKLVDVAKATSEDVNTAVLAARRAFDSNKWGVDGASGAQRAEMLREMAAGLRGEKEDWAILETLDSGKPMEESRADIDACAAIFDYFAGLAENLDKTATRDVDPLDPDMWAKVRKQPIGVVGMVTPWNFPLLQSVAKVAPALAAGCTMVLKPSSVAPMTSLRIGHLVERAGIPNGVVNIVSGMGRECGGAVVEHPLVDKVSFTGSGAAGKRIMRVCADLLRPVSMELGGKGAIVVFDDVDIESAVDWIMVGIFMCQGQVCSATSRLLVHENIAPKLMARLVEETKKIVVGDPFDAKTTMGPVISAEQHTQVAKYFKIARDDGASILTGGNVIDRPGYFLEPTIITDVPETSEVWREEIFGPVLAVRSFSTEQEAVRMANDTPFGLGNAVLSTDEGRAFRIASQIQSGSVWVNCNAAVPASVPFGGHKASGFGREFGVEGLEDYLHSKAYCFAKPGFSWKWYNKN